jgi:hypothetical protein
MEVMQVAAHPAVPDLVRRLGPFFMQQKKLFEECTGWINGSNGKKGIPLYCDTSGRA